MWNSFIRCHVLLLPSRFSTKIYQTFRRKSQFWRKEYCGRKGFGYTLSVNVIERRTFNYLCTRWHPLPEAVTSLAFQMARRLRELYYYDDYRATRNILQQTLINDFWFSIETKLFYQCLCHAMYNLLWKDQWAFSNRQRKKNSTHRKQMIVVLRVVGCAMATKVALAMHCLHYASTRSCRLLWRCTICCIFRKDVFSRTFNEKS